MTAKPASGSPLYRLVDDVSGHTLVTAATVDGLYRAAAEEPAGEVRLGGAMLIGGAPRPPWSEIVLQVVDVHGDVVGAEFLGAVRLLERPPDRAGSDDEVVIFLEKVSLPYPEAGRMWRRWASGRPLERGRWRQYPPHLHRTWLHIVQNAWFTAGRAADCCGDDAEHDLDGSYIACPESFYCELGEAVNGPGGYFGSNPSALEDCLRSCQHRGAAPLRLNWRNFARCERFLREATDPVNGETYDELEILLDVFRAHDVQVRFG